ncbi:MAG: hypothetical protein L3J77_05420, partial [Thermoplasmata archaeon]|nr:hypothetical protein [Thermoplasmata archaeon]
WVAAQCHARSTGTGQLHFSVRCLATSPVGEADALGATARSLGPRFVHASIALGSLRPYRPRWSARREWRSGAVRWFRSHRAFVAPPDAVARLTVAGFAAAPFGPALRRHAFVVGASGAGKTACLVHWASTAIRDRRAIVGWDVHGDLAPAILARLSPAERARVVAIDPTDGTAPGVQLLGGEDGIRGGAERSMLLAALRRVGNRDGETFWGFRIERVLDAFLRITEAEGGDLNDLVELLTDARRREAARMRLGPGELARFLDDLPAVVRRNPEFLWPASARLGPLANDPGLRRLVAPEGRALPLEQLLAGGTSVLWRLPIGELGPEAVEYVVTLLATRVFLGACRAGPWPSDRPPRVTVLLDEAHRIAPGLLAEMITEGRKFGLSVLAATQYPDRLQPEARSAVGSSVGTHVVFRLPRAAARAIAPWIGEDVETITTAIASLPDGRSIVLPNGPGAARQVVDWPAPPAAERGAWRAATEASRRAHVDDPESLDGFDGSTAESFLLGTLALEEQGRAATVSTLLRWAGTALPGDPAELPGQRQALLQRGWIELVDAERFRLTDPGRHWLGLDPRTGAVRESALHRALLLGTFRIFARHGIRLEILPQGSFAFRQPDARFRLRDELAGVSPAALADRIAWWQPHWLWRAFHGQDVHVEAEVSGALRPERIERGFAKG